MVIRLLKSWTSCHRYQAIACILSRPTRSNKAIIEHFRLAIKGESREEMWLCYVENQIRRSKL